MEYPRLVGALDLYCGDLGVAEELAQEALSRAWERWPRVRRLDNPAAWVRPVALNLASSYLRRLAAERRANERAARLHLPSPTMDTSTALAVREAVEALPKRMKTAVLLRYYFDLPYAEVAHVMRVPKATARSWVHRGLERLRREFPVERTKEVLDAI